MKSRPEYRSTFSSPDVFYRALHVISTRRYRLPVRRYIIDLFNLELNPALVIKLTECATALTKPTSPGASHAGVLDALERERKTLLSEDEQELVPVKKLAAAIEPTTSPRPVERIVGFDI